MKYVKILAPLMVLFCLLLVLVNAGHWLVINQPPRKADVIIVLNGTQMAISLYHMGYAPYLLFTRGDSSMKDEAIAQGVPAQAVILETRADSTYENALYSKPLIEQYGFHSALVISVDYHMLRVKLTFLKVFKNTGASFTFSSVRDHRFDNGNYWWKSSWSTRKVLREYGGIAALYLGLGPYVTDTVINRSPLLSLIFNS